MMQPDPEFEEDHPLETWVRADFDRRADGIDPRPLFQRIRQTMRNERAQGAIGLRPDRGRQRIFRLPTARRIGRWAGGLAAAAAAVVLAFIFGSHTSPVQASAEALVRDARR